MMKNLPSHRDRSQCLEIHIIFSGQHWIEQLLIVHDWRWKSMEFESQTQIISSKRCPIVYYLHKPSITFFLSLLCFVFYSLIMRKGSSICYYYYYYYAMYCGLCVFFLFLVRFFSDCQYALNWDNHNHHFRTQYLTKHTSHSSSKMSKIFTWNLFICPFTQLFTEHSRIRLIE